MPKRKPKTENERLSAAMHSLLQMNPDLFKFTEHPLGANIKTKNKSKNKEKQKMALLAKATGNGNGGNSNPLSAGPHSARCYAVIDLGDQFNEMYQHTQHKVLIIWETDETLTTQDGTEKPKAISKEYTLTLNEKSQLYKDLVSWRGKAFTEAELAGFDLANVVGAPCLLNIVDVKKGDRTYQNIGAITPLMKGMQKLEKFNDDIYFEITADSIATMDKKLPKWVCEKIKRSETYKQLTGQGGGGDAASGYYPDPPPMEEVPPAEAEELPF